jgi:hypothetical protein
VVMLDTAGSKAAALPTAEPVGVESVQPIVDLLKVASVLPSMESVAVASRIIVRHMSGMYSGVALPATPSSRTPVAHSTWEPPKQDSSTRYSRCWQNL